MKKLVWAASALLCAMICIRPSLTAAASAGDRYDYSRAGDAGAVKVTAADVLARYLESPLDAIEQEFLSHGDFFLTYSAGISSSYVTANFDGARHLTLEAAPYSYEAVNGRTVVWRPVSAEGGGSVQGEKLFYERTDVSPEDGDTVRVTYAAEVEIEAEALNSMLNAAYIAGMGASEKLEEEDARYQAAHKEYLEKKAEFDAYPEKLRQYEEAVAAYEAYRQSYSVWERKKADYDDYLVDRARYLEELAAYEAYDDAAARAEYDRAVAAYEQYLVAKEDYARKRAAYEAATASEEAQTVLYQLSLLAYIDKPVTDMERTIGAAIMGDTVTQVLSNTEALVTAGAERSAVNRAKAATVALRDLIEEYHACKTDAARYVYYIGCHEQLRKNFNDLLRTLDYFYRNHFVRSYAAEKGKTRQYEILLAQLYYLCLALDDSRIGNYYALYQSGKSEAAYYDASWRFGSANHSPADVLGPDERLEDRGKAAPLEDGYPAIPEPPVEPEEVPPTGPIPTPPRKPQPPEPVSDPGQAPAAVSQPGDPPKTVEEPTMPEPYLPTAEERALAEAYREQRLVERPAATASYLYPLTTAVEKYFRNPKIFTVYFYASADAAQPSHVVEEVELGEAVGYPYEIVVPEVRGYRCVFDGWVDEDGAFVDLAALRTERSDLRLYPHFAKTPIAYSVTWVIGNKREAATCDYDSVPVYGGETPQKKPSGARLYRFTGWEGKDGFYPAGTPLPVMTDRAVEYRAKFEESYVVTWSVEGQSPVSVAVWEGETPAYPGTPSRPADAFYSYAFTGWSPAVTAAHADAVYKATFAAREHVHAEGRKISVKNEGGMYEADCSGAYLNELGISSILSLASEAGCGLRIRFPNGVLTFSASAVYEADLAGVEKIVLTPVRVGDQSYLVDFTAQIRSRAASDWTAEYVLYGQFDRESTVLISRDAAGNESPVRFAISEEGDAITFNIRAGYRYEIAPQFDVVPVSVAEGLRVVPDKTLAKEGERVTLRLEGDLPAGTYLGAFYATTSAGERLELAEDASFLMPHGAVSVGAVLSYYEYTVVFKADGKVLMRLTGLHYGDDIASRAPEPKKATDGEYRYLFAGWDTPLAPVTGDAEYNAVFTQEAFTAEIPESSLNDVIRFAKVALPVGGGLLVLLIVWIVVHHVRKKRRKAENEPPMSGGKASAPQRNRQPQRRGDELPAWLREPAPPANPENPAPPTVIVAPVRPIRLSEERLPVRGAMPEAIRARTQSQNEASMPETPPAETPFPPADFTAEPTAVRPMYGYDASRAPAQSEAEPAAEVRASFSPLEGSSAPAEPAKEPVAVDFDDILREFGKLDSEDD